jgi:large subunit ribosomal protein L29
MKKKQWQELQNSTQPELVTRLDQMKKKLFNLSVQHKFAPLKNPLQLRMLRRDIARIMTLLRQKSNKKV